MLSAVASEDAFAKIGRDDAALRPGIERLCRRLGLDASGLTRYTAGSRPVYAVGETVLKLFPPVATWPAGRIEAEVLAAVEGRLPIAAPRAMRGDREYEFVAVGVFGSQGDARFLTRTLTAYGYRRDQLGPDLRRRLLAWGLLHQYSYLAGWMRRLPAPSKPTLDALADCWFATE